MHLKYFKFIPVIFLLITILMPQSVFAQDSATEIIKRYEKGELRNPAKFEKQIISDYLKSIKQQGPYWQNKVFSPDEVIYINENFTTATGTTPPSGWTQNRIAGDPGFDFWHFDNPGARTLNAPITSPAAIFDSDTYSSGGGAEDVALESPSFNAPAATIVMLEWNQYFQGGYGAVANVEVWNGSTWNLVYSTNVSTPDPDFKSVNISSYAAGVANAKVRFRWTGDYSWYWIVDNVKVYQPDPTPTPAVLVSPANGGTNINPYTSLNWIAGGGAAPTGYRINFGTNNPPTNIENNTNLGLVTTYIPNPILLPNTTYYWEIIPFNGAGSATGTVIWSFTTGADPTISTLPYTQNFDAVTEPLLPYGWSIENSNGDSYMWTTYTSGIPRSVPNHMSIRYSTVDAMNDWFFTPPIQVTGGVDYTLRFWYKTSPTYNESMEVKWGTSPTSAGMTQGPIFNNPSFNTTTYTEAVVNFTPSTSGKIYIGWHGYSIADQNRIFVDDVTFDVTPVVPTFSIAPTAKNFGNLNVNDTSIPQDFVITNTGVGTLTINSGGVTIVGTDASQFILNPITYPINLGAGQSDTVTVTFAPTSTGSKTANLQIVHNGAGGISLVPLTGIAFPSNTLIEDFSDVTFPPSNWLAINNDGGVENWLRDDQYYNSGPAAAGSYYEGSALQNDDWLITPKLTIANGDSLTFWHRARSTYIEVLYIKIGSTNDPNGTWTDIAVINDSTTSWKYKSYDLSSYLGDKYIAFVNRGFDQYAIFIDDILGPVKSEANTFQLSINLLNGWNMVSVPGTNSDGMGVANWWPGRVGDVYKYSGGYQTISTATPGIGYWMKNNGAQTYNTGDEWPAGGLGIVAHAPLTGVLGWNMIGGYEIAATASLVTTVPSGLQSGPIYKYAGGYSAATTIDPGFGYWIKLTGAGQIIIPETLSKDSKPVEYFPESWGRIILTDAAGVSYTLYAVNGNVNLEQYELPPAPPAGMYDFRYTSGRIAEDLNSSVKTIEMSGVVYPLTVRVEGMDMRLMDETGKTVNANLKDGESIEISESSIQKLMVSGELLPTVYSLEQNYPNPFNPSTMIEFSLPEMANVKLSIYNALGEKVAELVNTSLQAGKYQYKWNVPQSGIATGVYIYELRTDNFVSVKKMLLLK